MSRGFEIKNTERIVGQIFQTLHNRWKFEGIYEYPSHYQIHIRHLGPLPDRLYQLSKENSFLEYNSNFLIENSDSKQKTWVKRERISDATQFYLLMKDIVVSETENIVNPMPF